MCEVLTPEDGAGYYYKTFRILPLRDFSKILVLVGSLVASDRKIHPCIHFYLLSIILRSILSSLKIVNKMLA